MSKILLAQPKLKPGYIDLSVGEPHIIRETLLDEVDINQCLPKLNSKDFIYPSPCGYDKLIDFLEEKHGAKVVVTNGAKQGLGAAFYAAGQMGTKTLSTTSPYWALLPSLANLHNLKFSDSLNWKVPSKKNSCLVVGPNNPDGLIGDLEIYENLCKESGSVMIHDAAYYTNAYMPADIEKRLFGDVQIFSASKMLGLSSLRLGYVVCRNEEMYNHIQYYMEHMTVGVSRLPQMLMLNILKKIDMDSFESKCFESLEENRAIAATVSPDIFKIPKTRQYGMFLWAKVRDRDAFDRAKLHVIDGEPFGDRDHIRINLAFKKHTMQEIVDRLNKVSKSNG